MTYLLFFLSDPAPSFAGVCPAPKPVSTLVLPACAKTALSIYNQKHCLNTYICEESVSAVTQMNRYFKEQGHVSSKIATLLVMVTLEGYCHIAILPLLRLGNIVKRVTSICSL